MDIDTTATAVQNEEDMANAAEDEYTDIELSSRIVRDTLIKMVGTYRGDSNEASEFLYTTSVKKWSVNSEKPAIWEAELFHDSLFDAIMDAAHHAPEDDNWSEPDILRMVSQMIHEASHNARGGKS